jgi:hypothetical protein
MLAAKGQGKEQMTGRVRYRNGTAPVQIQATNLESQIQRHCNSMTLRHLRPETRTPQLSTGLDLRE